MVSDDDAVGQLECEADAGTEHHHHESNARAALHGLWHGIAKHVPSEERTTHCECEQTEAQIDTETRCNGAVECIGVALADSGTHEVHPSHGHAEDEQREIADEGVDQAPLAVTGIAQRGTV